MTTVDAIAKKAFDKVSAKITDAIHAATLTQAATEYACRAAFGAKVPATEFPQFTVGASAQKIALEGLTVAPADGDEVETAGNTWVILRASDVAQAGGLYLLQAVKEGDLWNATVSIHTRTQTADGMGGFTEAWNNPSAVNCHFHGISGAEAWKYGRETPANKWRCIVRWQSGVTAANRAVISGKTYAIIAAMDMGGRGKWLELILSEGSA